MRGGWGGWEGGGNIRVSCFHVMTLGSQAICGLVWTAQKYNTSSVKYSDFVVTLVFYWTIGKRRNVWHATYLS